MEGDTLAYFTPDEARISTHALTWRATTSLDEVARQMGIFLPTPSHGGRHFKLIGFFLFCDISTHALTWRATVASSVGVMFWPVFLPTPSHGGRRSCRRWSFVDSRNFYPRPHMEGDHYTGSGAGLSGDFYPRPHMEGDDYASMLL